MSGRLLQRAAIAVCGGLALGLVIVYGMMLHNGNVGLKQTDYVASYAGAHLTLEGEGAHIYSFAALGQYEKALVSPLTVRNGVLPYVYPPYLALAQVPLATLPYLGSYLVWLLVNCALLLLALTSLQRFASLSHAGKALFWSAAISFLPLFAALAQGQTSLLILGLLTGVFFAARARHDYLAGLMLAAALVKPPLLLPLLIVFLAWRRWRILGSFTLAALCAALGPMLLFGPGIDATYVHTLMRATTWHTEFGYGPQWNHSFAGFAQLLLPPPASTVITGLLDATALVLFVWCTIRSRQIELSFALAIVLALLVSPHVLVHDLTLLLLPVAVALRYRARSQRHLPVLLSVGYLSILVGFRLATVLPLQLSVIGISALGLWLVMETRRGSLPDSSVSRSAVI